MFAGDFQRLENCEGSTAGLHQRFFVCHYFAGITFQFGDKAVLRPDKQEVVRGEQYGSAGVARPLPCGDNRRTAGQLFAERFGGFNKAFDVNFFECMEMVEQIHRFSAQTLLFASLRSMERYLHRLENAIYPFGVVGQTEDFTGLERIAAVVVASRIS